MCCCDKPKTDAKTEAKPEASSCCGAPNVTTPNTETDPVCGMNVDPAKAAAQAKPTTSVVRDAPPSSAKHRRCICNRRRK